VTVDGKTLRGSGSTREGNPAGQRHLLAAFDHTHGVVLGQVDVDAKTNEVPMLPTLLGRLDLTGMVVTAHALHAVRSHAQYLHRRLTGPPTSPPDDATTPTTHQPAQRHPGQLSTTLPMPCSGGRAVDGLTNRSRTTRGCCPARRPYLAFRTSRT
jgi:hypothetical protein